MVSGSPSPTPATRLEWSGSVGKRVRTGDWDAQAVSTSTRIVEALRASGDVFGPGAGQREVAAQLVDYFMEEAKVVYLVYKVWTAGFEDWLHGQGTSPEHLRAELDRLAELLAYPDGTAFEPRSRWRRLAVESGALINGIRSYDLTVDEAERDLERLIDGWRALHDRYADLMAGLLTFVARSYGEAMLEQCFRTVLEPYIDERYSPFDLREHAYADTLARNLYISIEAMRGHLVGPGRRGDVELTEHDDRWVLRFDPCGSGGRQVRGDDIEGTGSRVLEPYGFGVTQQPHPWSWNEVGVCYYCAHCNFVLSLLPAERWGHPLRSVEPPLWRGTDAPETVRKCQWTVWKSLDAIPPEEYERLGRSKPSLPLFPDAGPPPRGPLQVEAGTA